MKFEALEDCIEFTLVLQIKSEQKIKDELIEVKPNLTNTIRNPSNSRHRQCLTTAPVAFVVAGQRQMKNICFKSVATAATDGDCVITNVIEPAKKNLPLPPNDRSRPSCTIATKSLSPKSKVTSLSVTFDNSTTASNISNIQQITNTVSKPLDSICNFAIKETKTVNNHMHTTTNSKEHFEPITRNKCTIESSNAKEKINSAYTSNTETSKGDKLQVENNEAQVSSVETKIIENVQINVEEPIREEDNPKKEEMVITESPSVAQTTSEPVINAENEENLLRKQHKNDNAATIREEKNTVKVTSKRTGKNPGTSLKEKSIKPVHPNNEEIAEDSTQKSSEPSTSEASPLHEQFKDNSTLSIGREKLGFEKIFSKTTVNATSFNEISSKVVHSQNCIGKNGLEEQTANNPKTSAEAHSEKIGLERLKDEEIRKNQPNFVQKTLKSMINIKQEKEHLKEPTKKDTVVNTPEEIPTINIPNIGDNLEQQTRKTSQSQLQKIDKDSLSVAKKPSESLTNAEEEEEDKQKHLNVQIINDNTCNMAERKLNSVEIPTTNILNVGVNLKQQKDPQSHKQQSDKHLLHGVQKATKFVAKQDESKQQIVNDTATNAPEEKINSGEPPTTNIPNTAANLEEPTCKTRHSQKQEIDKDLHLVVKKTSEPLTNTKEKQVIEGSATNKPEEDMNLKELLATQNMPNVDANLKQQSRETSHSQKQKIGKHSVSIVQKSLEMVNTVKEQNIDGNMANTPEEKLKSVGKHTTNIQNVVPNLKEETETKHYPRKQKIGKDSIHSAQKISKASIHNEKKNLKEEIVISNVPSTPEQKVNSESMPTTNVRDSENSLTTQSSRNDHSVNQQTKDTLLSVSKIKQDSAEQPTNINNKQQELRKSDVPGTGIKECLGTLKNNVQCSFETDKETHSSSIHASLETSGDKNILKTTEHEIDNKFEYVVEPELQNVCNKDIVTNINTFASPATRGGSPKKEVTQCELEQVETKKPPKVKGKAHKAPRSGVIEYSGKASGGFKHLKHEIQTCEAEKEERFSEHVQQQTGQVVNTSAGSLELSVPVETIMYSNFPVVKESVKNESNSGSQSTLSYQNVVCQDVPKKGKLLNEFPLKSSVSQQQLNNENSVISSFTDIVSKDEENKTDTRNTLEVVCTNKINQNQTLKNKASGNENINVTEAIAGRELDKSVTTDNSSSRKKKRKKQLIDDADIQTIEANKNSVDVNTICKKKRTEEKLTAEPEESRLSVGDMSYFHDHIKTRSRLLNMRPTDRKSYVESSTGEIFNPKTFQTTNVASTKSKSVCKDVKFQTCKNKEWSAESSKIQPSNVPTQTSFFDTERHNPQNEGDFANILIELSGQTLTTEDPLKNDDSDEALVIDEPRDVCVTKKGKTDHSVAHILNTPSNVSGSHGSNFPVDLSKSSQASPVRTPAQKKQGCQQTEIDEKQQQHKQKRKNSTPTKHSSNTTTASKRSCSSGESESEGTVVKHTRADTSRIQTRRGKGREAEKTEEVSGDKMLFKSKGVHALKTAVSQQTVKNEAAVNKNTSIERKHELNENKQTPPRKGKSDTEKLSEEHTTVTSKIKLLPSCSSDSEEADAKVQGRKQENQKKKPQIRRDSGRMTKQAAKDVVERANNKTNVNTITNYSNIEKRGEKRRLQSSSERGSASKYSGRDTVVERVNSECNIASVTNNESKEKRDQKTKSQSTGGNSSIMKLTKKSLVDHFDNVSGSTTKRTEQCSLVQHSNIKTNAASTASSESKAKLDQKKCRKGDESKIKAKHFVNNLDVEHENRLKNTADISDTKTLSRTLNTPTKCVPTENVMNYESYRPAVPKVIVESVHHQYMYDASRNTKVATHKPSASTVGTSLPIKYPKFSSNANVRNAGPEYGGVYMYTEYAPMRSENVTGVVPVPLVQGTEYAPAVFTPLNSASVTPSGTSVASMELFPEVTASHCMSTKDSIHPQAVFGLSSLHNLPTVVSSSNAMISSGTVYSTKSNILGNHIVNATIGPTPENTQISSMPDLTSLPMDTTNMPAALSSFASEQTEDEVDITEIMKKAGTDCVVGTETDGCK